MSKPSISLPPCGLFIGTGVYPMSADYLLSTLHAHQSWTPETFSPQQMIDRIIEDNQGNLAQLWGYPRGYAPSMLAEWVYALDQIGVKVPAPDWEAGTNLMPSDAPQLREHDERRGAGFLHFARMAATRGLYTIFIYTSAAREWSTRLQELGEHYLGYDFGERFTFALDSASLKGKQLSEVTLKTLADDLIAKVRAHVDERRAAGWGLIYATSSNFHIDYEIVAGTDVPLAEDFAFRHLNMASALSRGLYRQYDLPLWGSHLAHEHYSWIPWRCEEKFFLLRASMQQKYLAGCKMIINESGNWFVEASLCEDSPKFDFPRVPLHPSEVSWGGKPPLKFVPFIDEARKHFGKIDSGSEYCRRYRKEISDFYDFVKANGTPEGQPETTIAIAKGNYDLCNHTFNPNMAVAGAYGLADLNPQWFEGAPERGWDIVKDIFYPLRNVIDPYPNHFLSGTPFGMVDIVSLAGDGVSAEFLSANYKTLLFSGWNTATPQQYEALLAYVRAGGTLFIGIPHLSTNARRNYTSYGVDELINGGDFSELCGVRVKGPGERFYWATLPHDSDELGCRFPRRFGIIAAPIGEIEITDPHAVPLVVDDEMARPLLLRRACGKGTVYFLNSWAYPGAMNIDEGPGARVGSKGLIGTIYHHLASRSRGQVWISDDGKTTGRECEYVAFSYFPQAKKLCLQNVDFRHAHRLHLHRPGGVEEIELAPAQFMLRPVN